MVWVTLGLSSNIDPENNIASGLDVLLMRFADLSLSSVFKSQANGYQGPDYLNMVVGINTELPLQELVLLLKKIEMKQGRDPGATRLAPKSLDIDVLTYGDKVGNFDGTRLPRPEIVEVAYVLWPLAQIAPKKKHPILKRTYGELWQAFAKQPQKISPVNFNWHGRVISTQLKV